MSHPIQDMIIDEDNYKGQKHKYVRFKENKIVRFLLKNGPYNLNHLCQMEFSQDDIEQFYQLIGTSIPGYGELDFISDKTYEKVEKAAKQLLGEYTNV